MIKQQLEKDLKRVLNDLGYKATDSLLSIPQNSTFGDYSSNVALQLAKQLSVISHQSSVEIANKILEKLRSLSYLSHLEVKDPGFINFFIKEEALTKELEEILDKKESYGSSLMGKDEKVQVEFVSANPTGPLTLANGRGGVIGDTLSNVLSLIGYKVDREYYVNDTGNQVRLLGESVLAALGKAENKEEHYKGEYIKELAEKFKEKVDLEPLELGHLLSDYLLEQEIKKALQRFGVQFDEYYSERSVYEKDLINKTINLLKEKGVAYDSDGAVWFKASEFGDEKDRVLMTSEKERGKSEPTYFLADIAHHLDDLSRGYVKRINILGADHHGYALRIKGAVEALGYKDKLEIIFMQMVKLFKGGQEVRMSKRAGNFVTLDELLDIVGKDVARFFFLMYAPNTHIDFNLDLAEEQSSKNPVFYVQYAHARMANILNKGGDLPQFLTTTHFKYPHELALVKHLINFPNLVEEISQSFEVHKLTSYATELADLFHKFYESCRVLNAENEELKNARLSLVKASQIVLANTLRLMGISAPERM